MRNSEKQILLCPRMFLIRDKKRSEPSPFPALFHREACLHRNHQPTWPVSLVSQAWVLSAASLTLSSPDFQAMGEETTKTWVALVRALCFLLRVSPATYLSHRTTQCLESYAEHMLLNKNTWVTQPARHTFMKTATLFSRSTQSSEGPH